MRFCVTAGNLVRHTGYDFDTGALGEGTPAGGTLTSIMALGVAPVGSAFSVSAGSEDRNTAIAINLMFTQQDESVELEQQILVRNVP